MKCGKREEIQTVIADRAGSFKLLGLGFPLSDYLQTDIYAAVVLVCAVLFLVILDGLTVLIVNFNLNEL